MICLIILEGLYETIYVLSACNYGIVKGIASASNGSYYVVYTPYWVLNSAGFTIQAHNHSYTNYMPYNSTHHMRTCRLCNYNLYQKHNFLWIDDTHYICRNCNYSNNK